mmetsp:Transcript_9646/g.21469  ORF Transcript_9646/g.21469 Transcript_9646/m.21469 type:complete len:569 (-) Transcript_9646:64-1770(-)
MSTSSSSRRMPSLLFFVALLTVGRSRAFAGGISSSFINKPSNTVPRDRINGDALTTTSSSTSSSARTSLTILRAGASINNIPPPSQPTSRSLLKFYFPCLALWISGPLLSLVDTSFIGLSAKAGAVGAAGSAAQLAALGPATTFIDGSLYLFAFLNVATTNLYASALASAATGSTKNNSSGVAEKPGEGVVRTAAKTSLYSGIGLMVFLLAVARPLIALYIGPEAAASPGLLDAAHSYVKIRALSMPTSLLGGVLQAALLGAKDSVTPLVSILYSTIVNVCGDYLLVNRFHMGLKGAAIATLCAQLAGTVAMIGPARRELLSKGSSLGLLPRWITKRAPDEINAKTFLKFAAPVLTLILGKISAFGFMTNAAAGLPGQPATLAAHQIALSLFFFASPFLEVISQLSQAYLPSYGVLPKEERGRKANAAKWKAESNRLVFRLEKVGILVGALMAGVVGGIIAFLPGIVTKDATVQTAVKPLAATLAAGVALTAPVAVSEGTLIARKELSYLAGVYFVSTALLPPVLRRIRSGGGPVSQVWVCFALFQLFRSACFLGRILTTSGTKDKEE